MDAVLDPGKNYLRITVVSIAIALILFFGGGWVFVKMVGAAQRSRAAVAAAEVVEKPTILKLPKDIPVHKSGNVGKGKEYESVIVYEIIFTLGSIEEVKDFYKKEMPASGWEAYAAGSSSTQYMKTGGKQKASMNWQYYAGKPKLRLTISKISL